MAYNGVPADASIIDNIGPLTGSWKALIIYDPNNEYDAGAMEFSTSPLRVLESLSLTLDWYQIFGLTRRELRRIGHGGQCISRQVENGGSWASVRTIHLTQFYELNRKQYAVGTMDTPDGIPALMALVRL